MSTSTASSRLAAFAHRRPSAVGLLAAAVMVHGGPAALRLAGDERAAARPEGGLVVVAHTFIGNGASDLWHLRRHRDLVSPSLAEACIALDVPIGVAVLIAVLT